MTALITVGRKVSTEVRNEVWNEVSIEVWTEVENEVRNEAYLYIGNVNPEHLKLTSGF